MSVFKPPFSRVPGYDSVPPKLRSSQRAADYDGFFAAVDEALRLHMAAEAVPPEWNVIFTEQYPKTSEGQEPDQAYDAILYKIVSAVKAGGKTAVARGLERFDSRPHPDKARYHLVTEGWKEEVLVEFQVLSKSNSTASQIAQWFHKMMMVYAHGMKFFLARGIESFTYVGRQEDDSVTLFGQELYRRRIRYAFRLSFLVNYEAKDLELIHVAAHMGPAKESPISEFEWSLDDGSKPQR